MNKTRFLALVIVMLLISNFMLIWHITRNHAPRPGGGPRHIIIEKLDFDEAQVKRYDELIQWHRTEIRKDEEQLMLIKNELYSSISDNSAANKDSLLSRLAHTQSHIETVHLRHFQDIKALCRPDQMDEFNALMKEVAQLFAHPRPPHDQRPKAKH